MRNEKSLLLLLIIYTTFCPKAIAQDLYLSITGSTRTETKSIDSLFYQKKHATYQSLSTTIDSLTFQLKNQGYFDLQETNRLQKADTLHTVQLTLGNLYTRIHLKIPSSGSLTEYLRQNDIAITNDSIKIETAFAKALLNQLTITAANNGKPFTSFQIRDLSPTAKDHLQGILTITEDTTRYINNIIIAGYPKMPMTYIERYAGFNKGNVFN
ncbi:MAG: hypothetical protein ACJARZ_001416, partial [Dokdonia sp.]